MIETILQDLSIPLDIVEHKAVFTVKEALTVEDLCRYEPIKNLFLRDKKRKPFLCVLAATTYLPIKQIGKKIGTKELSFAKPELLEHYLGVTPGSVTPLGIINDTQQAVTVVLDKKLLSFEKIGIHPLRNTATLLISPHNLERFIKHQRNHYCIIDFEAK